MQVASVTVVLLALTELQIYSHTCVRRLCIFVCFYVCVCVFTDASCTVYYMCVMCFECYVWCTSGLCFIISNSTFFFFFYHAYSRLLPIFTCYCECICVRCAVLQSCHGAPWLDVMSWVTANITAFGWRSISVGVSLIKSLTFPSRRKYVMAVRSLINHTTEFLTLNFHGESQYKLQDWRRIAR